jgi:hypothetical protein
MHAEGATAIFEGTPEHLDLRWSVLDAKVGDLIPADNNYTMYAKDRSNPHMVVTFRVQRTYKGKPGLRVQVSTGMGGGDCGAVFTPGFTYLVYLYPSNAGEFGVGMCSPGGWIDSSETAPDLRYLRGQRPAASDLRPSKPYGQKTAKELEAEREQGRRQFDEYQRRLASLTGKICGTVIPEGLKDTHSGTVSFLSTLGYSPGARPLANVKEDGSFCSEPLGPGRYYLQFTRMSDEKLTSALYYPGVTERAEAIPIEVTAGQTQSNVVFKVAAQKTYSVRGLVSTNDKSNLHANDVAILLFRVDGDPRVDSYRTVVDFEGAFPLPKVKYFNLEDVLPGRYVAYVSAPGQGWFTRKLEVTVSTHSKIILMEFVHKPGNVRLRTGPSS